MNSPEVIILCGGAGAEGEVSRVSGHCVFEALNAHLATRLIELTENALPNHLTAAKGVYFPVIHGTFGEDGTLQRELEQRACIYAGCDAVSSALCIDKCAAKKAISGTGLLTAPDIAFDATAKPDAPSVVSELGSQLIVKPSREGSSIGLHVVNGRAQLSQIMDTLAEGHWMIEKRVSGRELSVGVLSGQAMGIVEIIPDEGIYDYQRKYTTGATQYRVPAKLSPALTSQIQAYCEAAFSALSCRDFARIDLILQEDEMPVFLEANTLPGLTPTSLYPKSAQCSGYGFTELLQRMLAPAFRRHEQAAEVDCGN